MVRNLQVETVRSQVLSLRHLHGVVTSPRRFLGIEDANIRGGFSQSSGPTDLRRRPNLPLSAP